MGFLLKGYRTGPIGHDWDNLIIMDVSSLSKTSKMGNLCHSRRPIANLEGMIEFVKPPYSNYDNTS